MIRAVAAYEMNMNAMYLRYLIKNKSSHVGSTGTCQRNGSTLVYGYHMDILSGIKMLIKINTGWTISMAPPTYLKNR